MNPAPPLVVYDDREVQDDYDVAIHEDNGSIGDIE